MARPRRRCSIAGKNAPGDKLNAEISAGLADPIIKARLADLGNIPFALSPAEFGKLLVEETEKWGKVVRAMGLKPE